MMPVLFKIGNIGPIYNKKRAKIKTSNIKVPKIDQFQTVNNIDSI